MNAYKNASYVGFVIVFFGIIIGLYGFSFLMDLVDLDENAIKVKGEVFAINEKAIYRSPFVRFSTLEGQEIEFLSEFEENVDFFDYEIGQEVDVIYHKDDPYNARIDAFWERNFGQLFLGIFGFFLVVFGFFIRKRFLKKAEKYA